MAHCYWDFQNFFLVKIMETLANPNQEVKLFGRFFASLIKKYPPSQNMAIYLGTFSLNNRFKDFPHQQISRFSSQWILTSSPNKFWHLALLYWNFPPLLPIMWTEGLRLLLFIRIRETIVNSDGVSILSQSSSAVIKDFRKGNEGGPILLWSFLILKNHE